MWYNHVSATHRRLKKRAKLSSDYPANLVTHYVTYKFDWFWIFAESESLSRESDTRHEDEDEDQDEDEGHCSNVEFPYCMAGSLGHLLLAVWTV